MPYTLKKQGSKFCVYNKDTGESKGCSDSKEMGLRHMRALYANAGDSKAVDSMCTCDICLCLDQYDSLEEVKELDEVTIANRVLAGIKGLFGKDDLELEVRLDVTKELVQGTERMRVTMAVSNTFKDRHGEIITEDAHKEYVEYVEETKDYPVFQLWHIPGSDWGQVDSVIYDQELKALTVSGLANEGMEYIAEAIAKDKGIGVSHGFKGWGRPGYVDWYRMKEASPLPRIEAANVWTGIVDGGGMALTDKQKKFLEGLNVPAVFIEDLDKRNKDIGLAAKEAGLALVEEPPAPPEPKPEPKPDEKVEATLPDGTKVQIPADVAKALTGPPTTLTPPSPSDVPEWAKELIESNKALKDELAEVKSKQTVESWEAAIKQGSGFVASKEGTPPSDAEKKDNGEWLAELIVGGAR